MVFDIPAVTLGGKSPAIWTLGSTAIIIAIAICESIQDGELQPFSVNPGYGWSDSTLIQFGAKLGGPIVAGEWWRIFTAIFVPSGIFGIVVILFIEWFVKAVERDSGFWRACLLFVIAGSYGYILSALFIPGWLTCGPTGAQMGLMGLLVCDLLSSWRGIENAKKDFILYLMFIMLLLVLGFTPYIDNWAHLGGGVMGVLFALMLLPNFQFKGCSMIVRGVMAFLAFPLMATVFMLSGVVVERGWSSW